MKIIHFNLHQPMCLLTPISACIGYFDGLHIGHQKLIEEVVRIAKNNNTATALITFSPDPWCVIKGLPIIGHITPMKKRIQIGETLGIQYWIIVAFDKEMAELSYDEFHKKVLQKLQLQTLVCGYDFHYAYKGEGTIATLQEQTYFDVSVVSKVSCEHEKISSTLIEHLIEAGDMKKTAQLLGRCYEMDGIVKGGNHVGHESGFPTANLECEEAYVIPKKGVYIGAVKVLEKWHRAIFNIGNNPTYNYQKELSIEAHILDFHEMIYGEPIRFRFIKYCREEKKFQDIQELSMQLELDEQRARTYFEGREELLLCD